MAVQLKKTEASEAWRAVMTAFTRVNSVLADEMAAQTDISLDWYGVLITLSQSDGGMRPSDLADAMGMSRSGTTRLIDRLEKAGLVERRMCGDDRRGTFVGLTEVGVVAFRKAGRVHLRGIEEHVGSVLSPDEMADLRRILGKLADASDSTALSMVGEHEPATS